MRKLFVAITITVLFLMLVTISFLMDGDDGLQVRAIDQTIAITNVGKTSVTIRDVILNDRLECSRWPLDNIYSPQELHALWVKGEIPMVTNVEQVKAIAKGDDHWEMLKTGETTYRASICSITIVNATIKTDHATRRYEFSY